MVVTGIEEATEGLKIIEFAAMTSPAEIARTISGEATVLVAEMVAGIIARAVARETTMIADEEVAMAAAKTAGTNEVATVVMTTSEKRIAKRDPAIAAAAIGEKAAVSAAERVAVTVAMIRVAASVAAMIKAVEMQSTTEAVSEKIVLTNAGAAVIETETLRRRKEKQQRSPRGGVTMSAIRRTLAVMCVAAATTMLTQEVDLTKTAGEVIKQQHPRTRRGREVQRRMMAAEGKSRTLRHQQRKMREMPLLDLPSCDVQKLIHTLVQVVAAMPGRLRPLVVVWPLLRTSRS